MGDAVTGAGQGTPDSGSQSTLPGIPDAALLTIRLNQSEFANAIGVSKNAVSKWVKAGVFTVGVDGRFDPLKALRAVLLRRDARQFRARLMRAAVPELHELQRESARAKLLDTELARARAEIESAKGEASRLRERLASAEAYGERAAGDLHALRRIVRASVQRLGPDAVPELARLIDA